MNGFKIKYEGFDDLVKKLEIKGLEQEVTAELAAFGFDVVRDAKILLSLGTVDMGFLSNSIDSESTRLSVRVFAHKDYAAYVEFGTGRFAAVYVPSLETEWQAIARTFFVNGKGRMPAQPYLHPAFEKNLPLLLDRLKKLLNA